MKKFLPYILILLITIGFLGPVDSVQAQGAADRQANVSAGIGVGAGGGSTSTVALAVNQGSENKVPSSNSCAWGSGATWAQCFADVVGIVAYNTVLKIAAFLLYLAGNILDFVLKFTVVDMAKRVEEMTGINIAWKLIRDLMNIAFIFMLVYEGIKMIIGQSDTGKAKTFITGIVLASLLINFSLFFTKVMIDASNIVTIGLYNSIIANSTGSGALQTGTLTESVGLSSPFMKALGMTSFYSNETFSKVQENVGKGNLLTFALLGTVLFAIVAFVFFAVACMFVIRYITLLVLLMLSPVAYMGMALPFTKKYATEWWTSLTGQLIFAPVYMLMTLIVLTLMTSKGFIVEGGWDSVVGGVGGRNGGATANGMGLIFNFVVIIGLAIASLTVAKKTASEGNSMIKQATGKLTAFAGGALMGGAGAVSRNTLGRAGNALANSEKLKDRAVNGGIIGRNFAKMSLKAGNNAATSTFDARSSRAMGAISSATGGAIFGKGADAKKVNFRKDLENKSKAQVEFAKQLKYSDDDMDDAKAKDKENIAKLDAEVKAAEGKAGEAKKTHDEATATISAEEKKIKEMEEEISKTLLDERKKEMEEEVKRMKDEVGNKKESLAKLKAVMTESDASLKEAQEAKKNYAKEEDAVKDKYSERVGKYADSFSEESKASRYSKNIMRFVTGGALGYAAGSAVAGGIAGGGATFTTKADSRMIARKIREVSKEKSDDEKLADLAKKVAAAERKKKKDAGEAVDDDEETTAPKPEAAPPAEKPAE